MTRGEYDRSIIVMAECMVTYGRGLDHFVRQEILQKIPHSNNVRNLGEGKIAFNTLRKNGTSHTEENEREEKDALRVIVDEQDDMGRNRVTLENTNDDVKVDTKGILREQDASSQVTMEAVGISTEEEDNQWVPAVSNIFKLKLVERVFTLLHCEDIDARSAHQDCGGKSKVDALHMDYENKLRNIVESINWDQLAVRVRRVKKHQDGERRMRCQDPDSCPGSLMKRHVRKELGKKRMASTSSRELVGILPKHHKVDSIKVETCQIGETKEQTSKRRKLTDDCELKSLAEPYHVCEHGNNKMQKIPESNVEETNNGSVKKECELENVHSNERQNLQGFHKDAKTEMIISCDHVTGVDIDSPRTIITHEQGTSKLDKVCASTEESYTCEDEEVVLSKTNNSTNKVDIITENCRSKQNIPLMKNDRPPSPPVHESKEVETENQDFKVNFSEHVSTFRVSSRVSGPHKNILTVKWINHTLGQELNKAMTAWEPDWRQPLLDLYVNITASHFIVGAALSPRPLSLRPYIPHLTLRSTISHLMATLSQVPPEAIVLDPMCGGGSILLETVMSFDVSHVIASDISREQLEVARCNLHNIQIPVTLLEANAERLPLQDSSINIVLCDFPFGHKYKLTMDGKQLLAGVLTEIQRLLILGGRAVFLLSPRQHQALSQLTWNKTNSSIPTNPSGDCLTLLESYLVSLGETSAHVAVLVKECPADVFNENKKEM